VLLRHSVAPLTFRPTTTRLSRKEMPLCQLLKTVRVPKENGSLSITIPSSDMNAGARGRGGGAWLWQQILARCGMDWFNGDQTRQSGGSTTVPPKRTEYYIPTSVQAHPPKRHGITVPSISLVKSVTQVSGTKICREKEGKSTPCPGAARSPAINSITGKRFR
jgi:hypothetical protein